MDLLTVPEIAKELRCSEWSAARLVRSGQIPAAKIAGAWKASRADVEAYFRGEKTAPPTTTRRRRRRSA